MNDLPPVDSSHRTSILSQHTGARVQGPSHQGNINPIFSDTITGIGSLIVLQFPLFPSAKELDEKNIVNVLHAADFADGDWELLGLQLIKHTDLTTIKANRHGEVSLCMIDTISQWLRNELEPSWNKLAEAVEKVTKYGKATANVVRQKAGIGKTDFVLKIKTCISLIALACVIFLISYVTCLFSRVIVTSSCFLLPDQEPQNVFHFRILYILWHILLYSMMVPYIRQPHTFYLCGSIYL